MPIISELKRSEVTDPKTLVRFKEMFGDREPTVEPGTVNGTRGNLWTVTAHSPAAMEILEASIAIMLKGDVMSRIYKELAIVRTNWNIGSQFTFSQHIKVARDVGVTAEQADAIHCWQTSELFDPIERLVLAYADDMSAHNGRVPDERMRAMRDNFTDEQIVELTYCISLWILHSVNCRALRLEWDDRDDPIVEIPLPQGYAWTPGN
ncbi:carboxymuconolactone decarboxylase family protein [Streptomyces chartreusis]|uniref:carboxymuconolactone decarboxylase family protein n=1 Tax=Streptomyces chartreusis TaxID=1969 RepID=UPI003415EE30